LALSDKVSDVPLIALDSV